MKIYNFFIIAFLSMTIGSLMSCDDHVYEDETWHRWTPGMIYCTNGEINTLEELKLNGNIPEAVIFYIDNSNQTNGKAYAVCINENASEPFCNPDTSYVAQGTSTDITKYDGEKNTAALRHSKIESPIANSIHPKYFIPSVAEMYKLYTAREIINPILLSCNGIPISTDKKDCWYWTSTECSGSEIDRAWVYSLTSGRFESADKHEGYPTRSIMCIRLNNEE